MSFVIILSFVALAILLVGAFALARDPIWTAIGGNPDQGNIDFETLQRSEPQNSALACPIEICKAGSPEISPPVYQVPARKLAEILAERISELPRVQRVDNRSVALESRYVARTKWMRFPDTVNIRVIPLSDERSTLAVFSRSLLGRSDLGANKERISSWLEMLDDLQKPDQATSPSASSTAS